MARQTPSQDAASDAIPPIGAYAPTPGMWTTDASQIRLSNAQARDAQSVIHPATHLAEHVRRGPQIFDRAEGVYVYDQNGRPFIEAMAGLWCAGLGFNNDELIEAATDQMRRLPFYHLFNGKSYEPAAALAEKMLEIWNRRAPHAPMARVFFACSGSEANDTQVKLLWYLNDLRGRHARKKVIARRKGYHGSTMVAASLTGLPRNHDGFSLPFDFVKHVGTPQFWREAAPGESEEAFSARLAAELDAMIEAEGPETVAGFIAEPVIGAGGVFIPPKGYFPAVAAVLAKHGVRMIDDEVICGFGRTGNWFGAETFDMQPQAVSFAKQLTGSYAPLSAVMVDQEMVDALEDQSTALGGFGHGFTYGGHPVACAVGLKTLEIYERENWPGRVAQVAPALARGLEALRGHPIVGDVRSTGLLAAVELAPDPSGQAAFQPAGKVGMRLADELLARGVVVRAIGDIIAICPPMIITEAQIDEMLAPFPAALDATLAWAAEQGLITHAPA